MQDAPSATPEKEPFVKRWDPLVRLTHWGVAAAILLNYLVTEEGSSWHVWVGYGAFALLILRLIWGLVGPAEARFTAFPPSLTRAKAHIDDIRAGRHVNHRSHNPLGALMVYALWGSLTMVAITGIAMAGSPFAPRTHEEHAAPIATVEMQTVEPPAYSDDDDDDDHEGHEAHEEDEGEEILEEIHEVFANLLLLLAALHVAGVVFETRRSGPGLIRAMIKGRGEEPRA